VIALDAVIQPQWTGKETGPPGYHVLR